jgi:dihydrofolate reductase
VIVTRNPDFHFEGADVAASLPEALEIATRKAEQTGSDEIYLLGGGEIYAQAIEIADMLRITHVETEISDGDTMFPAIDPDLFDKVEEIAIPAGEKDSYPTRFTTYVRRTATN